MTLSTADTTLESLNQLLDPSQIVTGDSLAHQLPSVFLPNTDHPPLVTPRSTDQLQALITWANRDRKQVLICGQGSKLAWGNLIQATDVIISTRQLNQIIDHAEADLTVTVQTGLLFQTLQSQIQSTGQLLPIDPVHPDQATIGGILATRDTGSLRHRYGGVRDLCLGLSFVRADGQLAKAGGRVVKNVAGYDLMKLFTGSFGTLGIITEVTLRLYPIQETSQTVILTGSTEAIATLAATLLDSTLTPTSIDFISKDLLASLGLTGDLGLAVRFQSLAESVLAQVQRLKAINPNLSAIDYPDTADAQLGPQIQSHLWTPAENTVIAKLGLLPQSIPQALQSIESWCTQSDAHCQIQMSAGSGIGTLKLTAEPTQLPVLIDQVRQLCQQYQGYLTLLEVPISLKPNLDIWGYSGSAIAPMKKLKAQFDPHHLLNPGRFVGGI